MLEDVSIAQCSTLLRLTQALDTFHFRGFLLQDVRQQWLCQNFNWHRGDKDANEDLVGDWVQYFDEEQFKCRHCNEERKFRNGGKGSSIQHSESQRELPLGEMER